VKILTSCPSCLQGLSRYSEDAGTTADYIVVEMARTCWARTGCRNT
jgi:Fe-S oxidoreductase